MRQIIEQKINSTAYNFLSSEPDLQNTIYLVASGSLGYGTHNENSDLDLRGILIEPEQYLYGLHTFDQFENKKYDTVIYGLKKFFRLALQGNPNILELLGIEAAGVIKCAKSGYWIRENVDIFLSRAVINSFGNYAVSQLRRLQNALARDSYPQEKKEEHILNTLNNLQDHFKNRYTHFESGKIELYPADSIKTEFEQEIFMNIHLQHYPLRDFIAIYSEMKDIVRSYDKLSSRNRKKDDPHLYKHAMHLIRLLITGIDILEGKGVITYRQKEQSLLLAIRNGELSFEEIFALFEQYQERFQYAAKHTALPEKPDEKRAEKLMCEIYLSQEHY